MAFRIALCDDAPLDRTYIRSILNSWSENRKQISHIVDFPSAESFLFRYAEDKAWDILLLDIEMGDMDGISLAKKIRQDNKSVQIVFITGFADYISEGYEVSALHYIMKPVKQEKLFSVLDRAVAAMQKSEAAVLLPLGGEMRRLPVEKIQYVEAFSHTVVIVTSDDAIQLKMPISELEKLLGDTFIRCHRSYLVGLKHIARLSKTEVVLDNGKTLPLSRSAASVMHKAFVSYYTGDNHETV